MNKKQILTVAAVLGLAGATQAQDITIKLTGATAFRAALFTALQSRIPGATISGTSSSSAYAFRGIWVDGATATGLNGLDVRIQGAWTGSAKGVEDLIDGDTLPFITETGAANPGPTDLAFSDVYQDATASSVAATGVDLSPYDNIVGIIPFVFAGNAATVAQGISNVTDQQSNYLHANGRIPLSIFTGDVADAGLNMHLTGRDTGSGTRATVLAETGYGIFTGIQQYHNGQTVTVLANGQLTRSSTENFATAPIAHLAYGAHPLGAGWQSGGDCRRDLNNTLCTQPFISWISIGDADDLKGTNGSVGTGDTDYQAWWLNYNGSRYDLSEGVANVVNGKYTAWANEHLYGKGASTDAETIGLPAIVTGIDDYLVSVSGPLAPGIANSLMNVFRGADGGAVN